MSILRSRKRRRLQRYSNSTIKYGSSPMPRTSLKYGSGIGMLSNGGVTRDFLSATMPSVTSISAPIFAGSIPASLLQNLTSLQSSYNSSKPQQSELHRYNVSQQLNGGDIVAESGNSTITTALGATNYNNILLSRELSNSNINNDTNTNAVNGNFYMQDNNNAHNRYYMHRNVHF